MVTTCKPHLTFVASFRVCFLTKSPWRRLELPLTPSERALHDHEFSPGFRVLRLITVPSEMRLHAVSHTEFGIAQKDGEFTKVQAVELVGLIHIELLAFVRRKTVELGNIQGGRQDQSHVWGSRESSF